MLASNVANHVYVSKGCVYFSINMCSKCCCGVTHSYNVTTFRFQILNVFFPPGGLRTDVTFALPKGLFKSRAGVVAANMCRHV